MRPGPPIASTERLKQMKTIHYSLHLKRVVLYAYHGCLPAENELGQRFIIDLSAKIALPAALESDDIEQLVSYAAVFEVAQKAFTQTTCKTLEAAASAMARAIFSAFEAITEISLSIEKPSVPVNCACESFGISTTFER